MPAEQHNASAPEAVERFVKQLNIAFKAVKLYPLTSNIPRDNADAALETLHQILQRDPEVRFEVAKEGLFFESAPVYPGHPAFVAFAREFYNRGIAEVRFHSGTTPDELLRFLSILDIPVPEIVSSAGVESRLWDLGVNGIAVKEVSTRIVEAAEAEPVQETPEEEWPPAAALLDDLLAESTARRPRAQRLLARVISEPDALGAYLAATSAEAGSQSFVTSRRLISLAHVVEGEPGDRQALYRSLANAIRELGADVIRDVIARLLGEAKHDEAVADVLRELPLTDLAEGLASGDTSGEDARAEIARSVHNLLGLGVATRDEIVGAIDDAMRAAGLAPEVREAILEDAAPSRLHVRERAGAPERPADEVLRILGISPEGFEPPAPESPLMRDLAAEAARGITDGDVFGALVTLVTLEERPEAFASLMAMLENNIGLLVERHDFDVAADAAEALVQGEQREELSESQRQRLHAALTQLAEPARMKTVTAALRQYPPGTTEHDSCKRLLAILGESTVLPLLEVLAEESDMANRRALVDMISNMAERFIPELGSRVDDPRWYFVRNVVGILAHTRDPRVLPYLGRTIRHPDARVRRETIRAVSSISDALATEMLVAALRDEDAGNVQLAARYAGSMRIRPAVPLLQEVARGEGRGSRDIETRVEAIEALGKIGSPEAVPLLEQISRQRSLRMGRARELRAAAAGALAAIKAGGGRA